MNLVMKNIEDINKEQIKKLTENKTITDFNPGDTVKVNVRIIEGKKQRIQAYEGVSVLQKKIEELTLHLQLEKFLLVRVWKEYFSFIAQT